MNTPKGSVAVLTQYKSMVRFTEKLQVYPHGGSVSIQSHGETKLQINPGDRGSVSVKNHRETTLQI